MIGADSTPTISSAVSKLRKILADNEGNDSIYGRAANGTIPIVVHVDSKVRDCRAGTLPRSRAAALTRRACFL